MVRKYATTVALIIGALIIALSVNAYAGASEAPTADPYPFGVNVDPSYVRIEHNTTADGRTQVCVSVNAPERFDAVSGQKLPAVHAQSCDAPAGR